MVSSIFLPSASRTSPNTTLAPSRVNRIASAAPCPRAPPLMSATLPSSFPMTSPPGFLHMAADAPPSNPDLGAAPAEPNGRHRERQQGAQATAHLTDLDLPVVATRHRGVGSVSKAVCAYAMATRTWPRRPRGTAHAPAGSCRCLM